MEEKKDISSKIEKAINSLDGIQKASPDPFFITRMQARLQRENTNGWDAVVSFITRPLVAAMCIIGILLINATAFYYQSNRQKIAVTEQTEIGYADEYNASSSYYYDENAEP